MGENCERYTVKYVKHVTFYCTDEYVIVLFKLRQKQTNGSSRAFIIKLLNFVKKDTAIGIVICYR